jgi:predicted kinase
MKKLILTIGIPGSGKTTLAKTLTEKGFERLCADDIRSELYGNAAEQGDAKQVFAIFFQRLEALLALGKDIVVDNTNTKYDHRKQIIERAQKFDYADIELWLLDVPLALCLERNKERTRQVEEKVLIGMFNQLQGYNKPKAQEGKIVIVAPGKDAETFLFS